MLLHSSSGAVGVAGAWEPEGVGMHAGGTPCIVLVAASSRHVTDATDALPRHVMQHDGLAEATMMRLHGLEPNGCPLPAMGLRKPRPSPSLPLHVAHAQPPPENNGQRQQQHAHGAQLKAEEAPAVAQEDGGQAAPTRHAQGTCHARCMPRAAFTQLRAPHGAALPTHQLDALPSVSASGHADRLCRSCRFSCPPPCSALPGPTRPPPSWLAAAAIACAPPAPVLCGSVPPPDTAPAPPHAPPPPRHGSEPWVSMHSENISSEEGAVQGEVHGRAHTRTRTCLLPSPPASPRPLTTDPTAHGRMTRVKERHWR